MVHLVNSLEEMQAVAKDFASKISPNQSSALVVGMYGDLGAGKTTFTQSLAKYFEVEDTVVSPTFVIEKIYTLKEKKFSHLIHIDAYRLEKSEELLHLGWKQIISDQKNLILIEWPERVADIMPEHIKVRIKHLENETSREVTIET